MMKVRENYCFTKITCSHATNESPQSQSHRHTAHNQHLVLEEEETTADDENFTIGVETISLEFSSSIIKSRNFHRCLIEGSQVFIAFDNDKSETAGGNWSEDNTHQVRYQAGLILGA